MNRADDTQWPRYEVFLQEREGEPYQEVGSVHAVDAEMALQNARDVFARRPECHSLWVVPADAIFAKTRQELESWQAAPEAGVEQEIYYISFKQKPAGTQTVAGTVQATSPETALQRALEQPPNPPPYAWWVFPARRVTASAPGEISSLFDPALSKTFRLSTEFKTVTAMRERKSNANE